MGWSSDLVIPPGDMRAPHFAEILSRRMPHYPISDKWEKMRPQPSQWWTSQREHMVAWFSEAETPGAYGRRRPQTAGQTYSRLLSAGGLLWINEALGADRTVIRAAANEAWAARHVSRRCGIIKGYLSWDYVYWLATDK